MIGLLPNLSCGGTAARASLGLLVAVLAAGCLPVIPPVTPGFVSTGPGTPGTADAQVEVQGGAMCLSPCAGGVNGVVHLDVHATQQDSVPIDLSVGYIAGSYMLAIPLRLGIRHRLPSGLSLGGGAGPNLMVSTQSGSGGPRGGLSADFEVALGRSFPEGAVSAAFRPGFSLTPSSDYPAEAIVVPAEVSGVYYLSDTLGLGVGLSGGFGVYFFNGDSTGIGAIAGSMTVVFRHQGAH